jgi:hypothetical protein
MAASGCTHVANTAPCDGSFCTTGDTCAGGACDRRTAAGLRRRQPPHHGRMPAVRRLPARRQREMPATTISSARSPITAARVRASDRRAIAVERRPVPDRHVDEGSTSASASRSPTAAVCNDGSACTTGETCTSGTCGGGGGVVCGPCETCRRAARVSDRAAPELPRVDAPLHEPPRDARPLDGHGRPRHLEAREERRDRDRRLPGIRSARPRTFCVFDQAKSRDARDRAERRDVRRCRAGGRSTRSASATPTSRRRPRASCASC